MKFLMVACGLCFYASLGSAPKVSAQAIAPGNNGVGTSINQSGTQFDIDGGMLSVDGKNLFHDFEKFGLATGQTANFLINPNINNILGRITGGEISFIDGLIQVTGGNSNLYLLNPAGLFFGANASLNVPGDFTATTATGIGFGDNWFSVFGTNNYFDLTGSPTAFVFDGENARGIVNEGNLSVEQGQNLNLFAGNIENSGTLQAESGQINILAIADKNVIQLSQEGSLLNLEISATELGDRFSAADLPKLLTGVGETNISGTLDVSGEVGGEVRILGQAIALEDAVINASGVNGGGNILIGGDKQGLGTLPTAKHVFVDANSTISASALAQGGGGQVIVFSEETGEIRGAIAARGGALFGDGGFIETSALNTLIVTSAVDAGATNGVGGEWLIDPTDITIVSGGGGSLAGNTVGATLINNALNTGTSVTLDTSAGALALGTDAGNITQNSDATISKTAGGEATLRFNADNSIFLNGSISSTSDQLNVTLNADHDGNGAGAIALNTGAQILSNGGEIILGGGADPAVGAAVGTAANVEGLALTGAILNSGGGDISLRGNGFAGVANDARGVYLAGNSVIDAGNGNLVINGNGGGDGTGSKNVGIEISSADLQTTNGSITLNGQGGLGTQENRAIALLNGKISSTNGNINLVGIGSTLTTGRDNDGIWSSASTIETMGSASITLEGTGGSGADRNDGIQIESISAISTLDGNISLKGTGSPIASSMGNSGISVVSNSTIQSTGQGSILLDGEGGTGSSRNDGIFLSASNTISLDGDITFIGQGGILSTGTFNNGIRILSSTVESIGNGAISFDGTGGAGTDDDNGIQTNFGTAIKTTNGAINLAGRGYLNSLGANDQALDIIASSIEAMGDGSISLSGDEINLTNSSQLSGQNNLLIQPETTTQNILLNGASDTNNGTLDLLSGDLASIQTGFSEIVIGRSDGSGLISLANNLTFSDPVTLRSPTNSGVINTNGFDVTGVDNASISLLASQNITAANITTPGNAVTLTSTNGTITTGNISTSANIGGDIFIEAKLAIATGLLDASGLVGDSGNVSLDPLGDIQVGAINAQGGSNGSGGDVDIVVGQYFRAINTFTAANGTAASISTSGGLGDGRVTIKHGGNGVIPFKVGDGSLNGTIGAIASGSDTFNPFQSFLYSTTFGKLNIISIDQPQIPQPPTIPGGSPSNPVNPLPNPPSIPLDINNDLGDLFPQTPSNLSFTDLNNLADSPLVVKLAASETDTEDFINAIDAEFTDSFNEYFAADSAIAPAFDNTISNDNSLGESNTDEIVKGIAAAQIQLRQVEQATGVTPAIIHAIFVPNGGQELLQLILTPPEGKSIIYQVNVSQRQVYQVAREFQNYVTSPRLSNRHIRPAQQLYTWLIAPLVDDLALLNIEHLTFTVDKGLRSLPWAALYDGQEFLIEQYSLSLMPSLSLTNLDYVDLKGLSVLAMGADTFTDDHPLPAVPLELDIVSNQVWRGEAHLNKDFSVENLKSIREATPYPILHLASHSDFQAGQPSNSFIRFGEERLGLHELRALGLHDPPVELLVLSACRTAIGDHEAELGFAGLAVLAGVKSALGSLWYVSDEGTLGLIADFYQQLGDAPTKSESLRQTQLAMLQGKVRLENGELVTSDKLFPLTPELEKLGDRQLTHPYYWSAFTIIGNPW